jgi:large subunit ribosomal protein L18|tara:strand:- start:209 stop:565 length:357 start_codon:yes stop_codon:yes gene_type:complete
MKTLNRKEARKKIHRRIRKKVSGTPARPRLAAHYSNMNIYVQIIDDTSGRTLCAASSLDKEVEGTGSNVATAEKVGALVASRAGELKISDVVFDRGGHLYHGKIKALAGAARAGGLKF